jgi:Cytochrome P460
MAPRSRRSNGNRERFSTPLFPRPRRTPGPLTEVEFIEKDSKRFADTHGWGYGAFKYNAASDTFTPVTLADKPPQRNDALPVA